MKNILILGGGGFIDGKNLRKIRI